MVKKRLEPEEFLFVDGYNIINSWESFKDFEKDNLEEARNKLIDILIEYKAYTGIEIFLVFDAHLVKGNSGNKDIINGLKIIYTQEYETADHYIERSISELVSKKGKFKRIRVATSDRLEQEIILSRGATRISARELEVEILGNKTYLNKKQVDDNKLNDFFFSQLSDEIVKKLKKIKTDE